jgi:hypothetical protein
LCVLGWSFFMLQQAQLKARNIDTLMSTPSNLWYPCAPQWGVRVTWSPLGMRRLATSGGFTGFPGYHAECCERSADSGVLEATCKPVLAKIANNRGGFRCIGWARASNISTILQRSMVVYPGSRVCSPFSGVTRRYIVMLRGKALARGVGSYTAGVQTDPSVLLAMKPILDTVEVYTFRKGKSST